MKRILLFSIFTLLCFVFAYVLLTFEKYNRQSFRYETDSQQSKIINSLENTSCIRNNSTNFFVYRGADKKSRIIDRPKTQGKQSSVLTDYEIDYEYPPETPVGMQEIQHAISHGAVGKITLRVVDSVGLPVEQANIYAWFYNGSLDKKIETSTDFEGFASLEAKNKGYVQFTITKKGYYSTGWRYWFIQRFCDTIQSNRWIPWNPTLEVVLKEKRNPQKMVSYQNTFRGKSFPNNQKIGFDLEKK